MPNNKLLTILITSVIVLIFFFLPFSEEQTKPEEISEETVEIEEGPDYDSELYSAPKKTAEVYDAETDDRILEIAGAGYSDGTWKKCKYS